MNYFKFFGYRLRFLCWTVTICIVKPHHICFLNTVSHKEINSLPTLLKRQACSVCWSVWYYLSWARTAAKQIINYVDTTTPLSVPVLLDTMAFRYFFSIRLPVRSMGIRATVCYSCYNSIITIVIFVIAKSATSDLTTSSQP